MRGRTRAWPYWVGTLLSILAASWCFLTATMNAHFSVAHRDPGFLRAARHWTYGFLTFGVTAIVLLVVAIVKQRRRDRLAQRSEPSGLSS